VTLFGTMRATLVSKRFNPGHISHLEANAKLLRSYGCDVRFYVHKSFLSFPDSSIKGSELGFLGFLTLRRGDLFIIWFPSISVVLDLLLVRLMTPATTVFVYHEPYTSFSNYREAGFGWLKSLRITAISFVSRITCALSDKIILPSLNAFNALPQAKSEPHRYAQINLMFADESRTIPHNVNREFVSYIGTIAEDHAFDQFVRLMVSCIAAQTLRPLRFLIATRSKVPEQQREVIEQCVSSGRLVLQSGIAMTSTQINRFYAQSFVVWNAYKRSMQSGVLPKAYMFGTPLLVSINNVSEYFQDGIHGILISDRYSLEEFQQAIIRLERTWSIISNNCRCYYLHNFDFRALSGTFMNFVSETA